MSESKEKRREYWQNFMRKLKSDSRRYEKWKHKRVEQTKNWRRRNPEKARACDKRKIEKMGRKEYNRRVLERYHKARKRIEDLLGNICSTCGYKPKEGQRKLQSHEIHGKKHEHTPYYILNHIEDFIPLCITCHQTVHFYHWYKKKIEVLERQLEG